MRGGDERSGSLFSCVDLEARVGKSHPLRTIRVIVNEALAALHMIEPRADRPQAITLGADKAYDAEDFVNELRSMKVTPHVAQNTSGRSSAIDDRTTAMALRCQPAHSQAAPFS